MERRVTHSAKNDEGDITGLCSPGASWSPRTKKHAIDDIESGTHTYYVDAAGYRSIVSVVKHANGTKFLRTTGDATNKNNLNNLPDC